MSGRGRGTCPRCHKEYLNRTKPPNCPKCGYFLGGTFQSAKKAKANNPWCKYVTSRDQIWLCTQENYCKIFRSVHINTGSVEDYECDHVKPAKNHGSCSDPVAVYHPDLSNYPCR
ncbi:HMG domain-containing protein 3 [Desmophyllum pertusum]|uniref:HMG domain-containing protein 3 n=1 Tax=Desmophyllum pertusum TaxID=174260 RepID=A0A9W9YP12_9CNID|nr:HMG domain-containing protein 3 [Desmophyllum pertusum]